MLEKKFILFIYNSYYDCFLREIAVILIFSDSVPGQP